MTTFLLVRHGETDAVGKLLMGWAAGWRLNQTGRTQARTLAERLRRLPVRAVYTSPLERALETAEAIASCHGMTPIPLDDLGEMRIGSWEGRNFQELDRDPEWRRFNVVRTLVRPPGGELMLETQARMVRRLLSLRSDHDSGTVVTVSHADPLRAVVAYFLGISLDAVLRFEIGLTSVTVLEMGKEHARILCVNETGEVPL